MMRTMFRAALLASLIALSGCSSVDLTSLEKDKKPFQTLASKWGERTGGKTVLLAPVLVPPVEPASDEETKSAAMRFDPAAFQAELERALGSVVRLASADDVPKLQRGGDVAAWKRKIAALAWEEQVDYVLYVRIEKWHAEFVETNGWWWPNAFLLGWYFWPIGPQWWIADEDYGVDLVVSLELQRVASETPLPGLSGRSIRIRTIDAPEKLRALDVIPAPRVSLDDLDRGLDLFGTWVTGSLEADQWEQVGALLDPYARRVAAVRAAATVGDGVANFVEMKPNAKRQVLAKLATTHALVVGISEYPNEPCVGAQADAEAVGRLLRSELAPISGETGEALGGTVRWAPPKNVIVLRNEDATVARITSALTTLQRRAEPQDRVIVYFAGRGARTGKTGAAGLSLRCYPSAKAARTLSLTQLGAMLQRIPAGDRIVAIDAGFGAGPRGSAKPAGGVIERRALETQVRDALMVGAKGGGVVLAADTSTRAQVLEVENAPRGLLTTFLVRGLRGEADAGGDGLSWKDLGDYLAERVGNLADVALEHPQRPLVIGAGSVR